MMHDNIETMKELLKICLQNGINFFDTAEAYGFGVAEKTFGQAIKELKVPREKIVVSIKYLNLGRIQMILEKEENISLKVLKIR